MSTEAGHLHNERKHLQSTSTNKKIQEKIVKLIQKASKGQPFKQTLEENILKDSFPPSDLQDIKTHQLVFSIIESSHARIGYTYLTGRFPSRSSRGNECILITYHYDANAILAERIKNRQAETITQAWTKINKIRFSWYTAAYLHHGQRVFQSLKDSFD